MMMATKKKVDVSDTRYLQVVSDINTLLERAPAENKAVLRDLMQHTDNKTAQLLDDTYGLLSSRAECVTVGFAVALAAISRTTQHLHSACGGQLQPTECLAIVLRFLHAKAAEQAASGEWVKGQCVKQR
jgi:hypothetical protein